MILDSQRKLRSLCFVVLLLILAGFFLFRPIFSFLAVTNRKQTDILVVEGWVPKYNLRLAMEEFRQHAYSQMLIASIMLPAEFEMYSVGGLIFDLTENQQIIPQRLKKVTVMAYSTPVEGKYAHFTLIVNDSIVGEATTHPELASYSFDLSHFQEPVRKIIVKFNNDSHTEEEDRNLYVHSLIVDNKQLKARSPYVIYDRSKIDGKKLVRTDLFSEAEEAKQFLLEEGLPDSLIFVLNAPEVQFDRTYTSAQTVRAWMEDNYNAFPAFNIFTKNVHARRTRMLYDIAFHGQAEIGIIASSSPDFNESNWWKVKEGRHFVLEQVLKYLYAKFLFYPS